MQIGYQDETVGKIKFDNDTVLMKDTMTINFNIGEVRSLIFDLGEDSEIIASGVVNISRLAQETVRWFGSRERLSELWNAIAKERPHLNWETTDGSVVEPLSEPVVEEAPDESVGEEWELLTELSRINMRIMEITTKLMQLNIQKNIQEEKE